MSGKRLTVLILGGYGTFGGRLAELLADEPRLTLVVAGRSRDKAAAFCARLPRDGAVTRPLAFDRDGDVEQQLRAAAPDLIVDATGPFQSYGASPYRVVEAALALGIDYLDLADGSDFVKGIARFDSTARERGVIVLSGVSSFPVLTAAVVRRLAHDMAAVESITGGIAPSPFAGVGQNVIRAIAGYAGQPVTLRHDGRAATRHALTEGQRYTIAPPGRLPLDPILFSLVDVPDLLVLPDLWPEVRTVWMGAGPVPEILHRALNALAWAVRLRLLPSLVPFAGLMYRVINVLRWGEHRGGMFVAVAGKGADGRTIARSWHLLAEGDDGPFIPSMAAEAIIRKSLDGAPPAPGARPATTDLELTDYEALFARRTIYTGVREAPAPDVPLYRRVLGEAWATLPPALKTMHEPGAALVAEGRATVERGTGLLVRLVAALFRFPPSAQDVPVTVAFTVRDGRETWRRSFGARSFTSVQEAGQGRFERLLVERFGPFAFGLALVIEDGRLYLVPRRWTFLGVPLPRAFLPRGQSYEFAADGRFHFHVEIAQPLTGLIVAYRGWLVPGLSSNVGTRRAIDGAIA